MFLELTEMTEARRRSIASRTLRGRAFNILGYCLMVFCVYKMAMSLFNIVARRDPNKDPVTLLSEWGLRYAGIQVRAFSRKYVSLYLNFCVKYA